MWHYAQYQGKELLVVGHSPRRNDCILIDLAGLPMNESTELRRIATSVPGQQKDHLVLLLKDLVSPDKIQDWFTYLCRKMEQRNSPVFTLPLKEIQDSLDEDQRAIFKGYGKGRKNKYLDVLNEGNEIHPEATAEPMQRAVNSNAVEAAISSAYPGTPMNTVNPDLGYKMDVMLETLVDESRRTQQLLAKLVGALTDSSDTETAAPEEPTQKPRRSTRKKTENTERAHA